MTKFRQPSLAVTFLATDHNQRRCEISYAHNLLL
jgi:hypothetical protein